MTGFVRCARGRGAAPQLDLERTNSTCSSSGPGSAAARSRTRCREPGSRCCWSNAAAGRRATRPTGTGGPSCSTAAIAVKPRSACASPASRRRSIRSRTRWSAATRISSAARRCACARPISRAGQSPTPISNRTTPRRNRCWRCTAAPATTRASRRVRAATHTRPRRCRRQRSASPKRRALGLHPFHIPIAINHAGARDPKCINCVTCDGFPCRIGAKNDVTQTALAKADTANLAVVARVLAARVVERDGRITAVEAIGLDSRDGGRRLTLRARLFVLSGGSIGSAALMLRSGLAARDASGTLGRNLCATATR